MTADRDDLQLSRRPLVYVSGPLSGTANVVDANIREAIRVGRIVYEAGGADFVPHLSWYAHLRRPRPYEAWMAVDLAIVAKSDLVVRIPGKSPGADREVALAHELSIPVCAPGEAEEWIRGWHRQVNERGRV